MLRKCYNDSPLKLFVLIENIKTHYRADIHVRHYVAGASYERHIDKCFDNFLGSKPLS